MNIEQSQNLEQWLDEIEGLLKGTDENKQNEDPIVTEAQTSKENGTDSNLTDDDDTEM